jgi:hypothetical protein
VKPLAVSLVALSLGVALQAHGAPPSSSPGSAAPSRARPVILINPRDYLATPTPHPVRHATPRPRPTPRRHPLAGPTPEVFEHLETAPSPTPRP